MTEIVSGDICFEPDCHAYTDTDGKRCMSTTQAISLAGLIDYSMVPPSTLAHASWRGTLVHQATALHDRGEDLQDYDIPDDVAPYILAYQLFLRETGFVPDLERIERPAIVEIAGLRVGMTPDRIGVLDGAPAVVELKATAARHPSWGVQLASYEMGQPRPARFRQYNRVAVQLLPTARYKLWAYEDPCDFEIFLDAFRIAAWKLKHGLAKLD
jgi:hypothetical protein